ncbi:MAG: acylphosphatase [Bacteroidales bacterium]
MKQAITLTIKGRVQNVGFRFSALRKAEELDINGYVKNQIDGTVYIEAEGEPEKLNKFINWCHEGPPAANVQQVNKQEIGTKDYKGFVIK